MDLLARFRSKGGTTNGLEPPSRPLVNFCGKDHDEDHDEVRDKVCDKVCDKDHTRSATRSATRYRLMYPKGFKTTAFERDKLLLRDYILVLHSFQ